MPRHDLTKAENAKGGRARAENIRQRRAQAEQQAIERLSEELCRATDVLAEAMEAEAFALTEAGPVPLGPAHATRVRAAAQVLDRVLGRATQRTEHTGSIDFKVEYRERLASLLADRAARVKANGDT